MDFGGFNTEAANRGAYAGVVHGIASRPKTKPKPAATPARAPPSWTVKARYFDCVLALI